MKEALILKFSDLILLSEKSVVRCTTRRKNWYVTSNGANNYVRTNGAIKLY
jgi:hypothetical protein